MYAYNERATLAEIFMRSVGEELFGQNVFTHFCLDHQLLCETVPVLISAVFYCVAVGAICTVSHLLNTTVTMYALESMSLRRGVTAEAGIIIMRNLLLCLPDLVFVSFSVLNHDINGGLAYICQTVLAGGWVSLLLIPGLIALKCEGRIPLRATLRSIAFIAISLVLWSHMIPSHGFGMTTCLILVSVFGSYTFATWRSIRVEQDERDIRRESRLFFQLAPITESLESDNSMSQIHLQLVGPPDQPPTLVYRPKPVSEFSALSHSRSSRLESLISRILEHACVRALPGTDSERHYGVSILLALIFEIVLMTAQVYLCDGLVDLIGDFPIGGALIFALVSRANLIVPIMNSHADPALVNESLGSHVTGLTIGCAVPWIFAGLFGNGTVRNTFVSIPGIALGCSAFALCLFSILSIHAISRSGNVLSADLSKLSGKLLTSGFVLVAVIVTVF